jgi:hypothetical protein
MPVSELIQKRIETQLAVMFDRRLPKAYRNEVKLGFEVGKNVVTLFESRPRYNDPKEWIKIEFARIRYTNITGLWTLYCGDQNGKWHKYQMAKPTRDVSRLIREIDEDPTGIFFG